MRGLLRPLQSLEGGALGRRLVIRFWLQIPEATGLDLWTPSGTLEGLKGEEAMIYTRTD